MFPWSIISIQADHTEMDGPLALIILLEDDGKTVAPTPMVVPERRVMVGDKHRAPLHAGDDVDRIEVLAALVNEDTTPVPVG